MKKAVTMVSSAVFLLLISLLPLSHSSANSLSGNDIQKTQETQGGNDMHVNSQSQDAAVTQGGLESALNCFSESLFEMMSTYRGQDNSRITDLMEVMDEINETLASLYSEVKTKNEYDINMSEYLLHEYGPEAFELSETEPETEPETESETESLEEKAMEKSLNYQSVSSANLDDVDENLLLIIDELRIANENDAAFAKTVKSLLSGIILAVTIGTGFIAGLIALRRFR